MPHRVTLLSMTLLVAAGAPGDVRAQAATAPEAIGIDHESVGCVVAGQHPVFEADFDPADAVGAARLWFRARGDEYWYSVDMERRDETFLGILPRPEASLAGFDYYIDVIGTNLAPSRTEEYSPRVADGPGACESMRMAGVLASALVRVILPAGVPGAALVPAGFSVAGVTAAAGAAAVAGTAAGAAASGGSATGAAGAGAAGGGGGISGATVGIGAAAVGAVAGALALSGGGDDGEAAPGATAVDLPPARFVGAGTGFVVRHYSEPCTTVRPYEWREVILELDGPTGMATMTRQATDAGVLLPCSVPGRQIPDYSAVVQFPLSVAGTSVTATGFSIGGGWSFALQATRSGDTIDGTFTYQDGNPTDCCDYTFEPPTTPFTVTRVQ